MDYLNGYDVIKDFVEYIAILILDLLTSRVSQLSFTIISVTLSILWYSPVIQWVAQCCSLQLVDK